MGVRLYFAVEDSGGYAVHAPPKPPPGANSEAMSTMVLMRNSW
jgi:hypothetical protein